MPEIHIQWTSDDNDCEQCGGGYATGAIVTIDGEVVLHLEPVASCFGSEKDWSEADVYSLILEHLGYKVSAS